MGKYALVERDGNILQIFEASSKASARKGVLAEMEHDADWTPKEARSHLDELHIVRLWGRDSETLKVGDWLPMRYRL